MIDPFEDPRDMDPANWDCCDEHETVFRKGDACPKCEPEPLEQFEDDDRFGELVEQVRAERIAKGLNPDTGLPANSSE